MLPGARTWRLPVTLRYGVAVVAAGVACMLGFGAVRSGTGVVTAHDAVIAPTPVQSLALARDALQLEPRAADAHIAAAAARRQLGDPTGALADLIAALRLEPAELHRLAGRRAPGGDRPRRPRRCGQPRCAAPTSRRGSGGRC